MTPPPSPWVRIAHRWKELAATSIAMITIVVLLIFFVGELGSGDWSSFSHLVQMAPIAVLVVLGWWRPRIAGGLLLVVGLALAIMFFLDARPRGDFDASVAFTQLLLVEAIFFLPPPIAGLVFLTIRPGMRDGRKDEPGARSTAQ